MRIVRTFAAACLLALAAGARDVRADGSADGGAVAPGSVRGLVEQAAAVLAAAGRGDEMRDALALGADLGADAASVAKLRASCERALAAAGAGTAAVPEAGKMLRQAATDLRNALSTAGDDAKPQLARWIVRIDDTVASAHELLGDYQMFGRWFTAEQASTYRRRSEIAAAVAAARRVEIPLENDRAGDPRIREITSKPGSRVVWRNVELHFGAMPRERAERVLTQALRVLALSRWLRGGKMEPRPFEAAGVRFVLWGDPEIRGDVIKNLKKHGLLKPEDAAELEATTRMCFEDTERAVHLFDATDGGMTGYLAYFMWCQVGFEAYGGEVQQCLLAGHLDWILRSVAGTTFPRIGWGAEPGPPEGSQADPARAERDELWRLRRSGAAGGRAWMQWLARRRLDPPWSRSMTDELWRIAGDDLLKSSLAAEYLHETGKIDALLKNSLGKTPVASAIEGALGGGSLDDFEKRWRSWLLGCDEGLVARVERPAGPAGSAAGGGSGGAAAEASPERRMLARLDAIRMSAVPPAQRLEVAPLRADPALSAGCRAHAIYLGKNAAQLAKWPDMHEEVAGRDGVSPEGCRAGLASLIASGAAGADEAVDRWMASVHQRLALLDPGLLRVGFASEGSVTVLDVRSLVAPAVNPIWTVWPPADAQGVPRQLGNGQPGAVPASAAGPWGYPVTVQVFPPEPAPGVRLTLSLAGKPVDCFVSSPDAPVNPAAAPRGAFWLVPKAPLDAGATYTVVAEGLPRAGRAEWKFTTAK